MIRVAIVSVETQRGGAPREQHVVDDTRGDEQEHNEGEISDNAAIQPL